MLTALADGRALPTGELARTCYDHLAGRRGVELRDRLLAAGVRRVAGDRLDAWLAPEAHSGDLVADQRG
jgi:hypothetical protein